MKTATTPTMPTSFRTGHISMMHRPYGPRFHLDPENTDGQTDAEKAAAEAAAKEAAEKAAAEAAAKEAADKAAAEAAAKEAAEKEAAEKAQLEADRKAGKLTDKEFELLTDTMKHKATAREAKAAAEEAARKLKAFDGIDPAKIKELIENEAKAKEAAEKAAREAIEKSGDVERIKKMMADEHQKVVDQLKTQLKEKDTKIDGAQRTIEDLTVGSAFSQSSYIADELVLTPQIARQVYSPHFDVVNGKITPFDKPRGEAGRTPLVDASGNALSVDAALKKLVDASPDRDKLVRSTIAPGAGSRTETTRTGVKSAEDGLRGVARIQSALNAGALKKAGTK